jgi:hypothetical protein
VIDLQPPEFDEPERAQKNEDVIYEALGELAGVDTHDINLRDHPEAWGIMGRLAAHIYNEGRTDRAQLDAKLLESLASHIRIGLN